MSNKKKGTFWNLIDRLEGDKVVWIIVLLLFLFSIVCMFSSTSRLLRGDATRLEIVADQFVAVGFGLAVIIGLYNIKNIKVFRVGAMLGFPLSFILLLLLDTHANLGFIKAIELNGAYRILAVPGLQIHVFEVVKVSMILYLAWALDSSKRGLLKLGNLSKQWLKVLFIYAPFLIIFMMIVPGSNSSALVIGGIMFVTILLGGGNFKDMAILAAAGCVALGICVGIFYISGGNYMKRIGTGVNRIFEDQDWEKQFLSSGRGTVKWQEALDEMRQPVSAKIAIKEGGIIGKGPGQSTQRYVVPDISEDYMYSFIIEEYGILGGIAVICLYLSLLARGSIIVRNCGSDSFAKLSVAGLCLLITGQAFLHMFVNVGIGPMTGQTLPIISHGTSALLCFCVAFGVILSISRIAVRRIAKETSAAEPLMHMHEVNASLSDLDAFESGKMDEYNEI